MSDQLIESRQWESYAQEEREREETQNNIEVEIWHNGLPDIFFCHLRRIGTTRQPDTGMIAETWEPVTKKDMAQTFTVMLHEGTLESHVQYCKYRETDHGARLIQKLGYIALLIIYLPLMSALGGLIPSELDLLAWYWIGPICAVAGMFATMTLYNRASVCGRVVLECAYPDLEQGGNHICYIVASKTANVIQQLNALDRYAGFIPDLVKGHNKNLGAKRIADKDRIMELEYELSKDRRTIQHRAIQDVQRELSLSRTSERRAGLSPAQVITAVILVGLACALLVYYASGGA